MAMYVGLDSNALELYHYGRAGMKWGKHIFGNEIAGAVRRAAGRARTASVLASVRTTSGAKKAYSSLMRAANKTSAGKRINQARASAAMAKALRDKSNPVENAIRKALQSRQNAGSTVRNLYDYNWRAGWDADKQYDDYTHTGYSASKRVKGGRSLTAPAVTKTVSLPREARNLSRYRNAGAQYYDWLKRMKLA